MVEKWVKTRVHLIVIIYEVSFLKVKSYQREKAVLYAKKWAYARNPLYYNYDKIGGDCTNFVSQCIYEAGKVMNTKDWYYNHANDKSPSWTGVEYLYQFLISNKQVGPFGKKAEQEEMEIGDVIQLSFDGTTYSHSLLVVENKEEIRVATHTFDSYGRSILTYEYKEIRFVHIEGIRNW